MTLPYLCQPTPDPWSSEPHPLPNLSIIALDIHNVSQRQHVRTPAVATIVVIVVIVDHHGAWGCIVVVVIVVVDCTWA